MTRPRFISADLLVGLTYDPETGIVARPDRPLLTQTMGGGYLNFRLDDRHYYAAHRVAWVMVTGEQPPLIDHRDLDRSNNRWVNLRAATPTQNNANWKPRGPYGKGVTLLKNGRYRAQIGMNRRHYRLGEFKTPEEAHEVYMAKARELFGEFARAE